MAFSLRNPVRAEIEDRISILIQLTSEFPRLQSQYFKEIEEKSTKDAIDKARSISCGDVEVYQSIIHDNNRNLQLQNEYFEAIKYSFYSSMLIASCVLYENILNKIFQENNVRTIKGKTKLEAICSACNIVLTKESRKSVEFISNQAIIIRNKLTHDGSGTINTNDSVKVNIISKANQDIQFDKNYIIITGDSFILNTLAHIKHVLLELCDNLGYKSQLIGK